jgi:hypothetical protein
MSTAVESPGMRKKISAESVIAATIASLRHSKDNAYDIAKIVIRDLKHFGYDIQRKPDGGEFYPDQDVGSA